MEFAWMTIVGLFLLTWLTTYGFFLNVEASKRMATTEVLEPAFERGTLSAKLDEELVVAAEADGSLDATVLARLEDQELLLAEDCEARGQKLEAQIHRNIATSVARERRALSGGRASRVA